MPNRNHSHFLSINNFYVIHCSNVPHSRKITKILQPKITWNKNKRLVRAAYTHNKGKYQFSEGCFVDFLPSSSSNFFLRFWMWEIPNVRIVRMMSHNVDLQLVAIVASFLFVQSYFRGLWAGRFFGYVCDGGLTGGCVTAQSVDGIDLYLYFVTDGRSSELCGVLFGDVVSEAPPATVPTCRSPLMLVLWPTDNGVIWTTSTSFSSTFPSKAIFNSEPERFTALKSGSKPVMLSTGVVNGVVIPISSRFMLQRT